MMSKFMSLFFIFLTATATANTAFPTNEQLVKQFHDMGVMNKNQWNKGAVVDGIQVYTARTKSDMTQNVWMLGTKEAAVIVLSAGDDIPTESIQALNECFKVVKGVTGSDEKNNFHSVVEIFRQAAATRNDKGEYQYAGVIDDKTFEVTMKRMTETVFSFSCAMRRH